MQIVAVIDIGKTNAKVALVDLAQRIEVAVETQPNVVIPGPPWPHFDVEGQWAFFKSALRRLATSARIDGIVVTTHGACAALLGADGDLAVPVLDYEHVGPDALRAEYDAIRPPFAETGSPALPMGLNLGAQLHWMLAEVSGLRKRLAHVVAWPQYWGYRLTGGLASDLSSLGAHTDLWNVQTGTWSPLVARLGLTDCMAPARQPGEVLGLLRPDLQAELALDALPVLVGIHDSNASLLPHLAGRATPFSVVSTGTWVISMAIGGAAMQLDPARDTLVNVNAYGQPVPSARFMGGREFDLIRAGSAATGSVEEAALVRARGVMLMPSVLPGQGPFQGRQHRWTLEPEAEGERAVALGYYLAMMTAEGLGLIGAAGETLIEGPFAANIHFCQMLAAATGRGVVASQARTGTALGAALLFAPKAEGRADQVAAMMPDPELRRYADAWRAECAKG